MSLKWKTKKRESFLERMQELVDIAGSVNALSVKSGVPQSTLRNYFKSGEPGRLHLIALAESVGKSVEWLAVGGSANKKLQANADYTNIPLYSAEASLGKGMMVDNEYVEDVVSFRESWLRQELRVDPNQLSMVFATGDSMSPTIQSGEMVMIDHSAVDKITDGIWALTMGGGLMVKRVQAVSKTSLQIISDNKAYDTKNIDLNNPQDGFNLIGRVVWHGRRV